MNPTDTASQHLFHQRLVPQWRRKLMLPLGLWAFSFVPCGLLLTSPIILVIILYVAAIPALLVVSLMPVATSIVAAQNTLLSIKSRGMEISPDNNGAMAGAFHRLQLPMQLFVSFSLGMLLLIACIPARAQFYADGYDPCVISPLGNTFCQGLLDSNQMPHLYSAVQWLSLFAWLAAASISAVGFNAVATALSIRLALKTKRLWTAVLGTAVFLLPMMVVLNLVIVPEMFLWNVQNREAARSVLHIVFDVSFAFIPYFISRALAKPLRYPVPNGGTS